MKIGFNKLDITPQTAVYQAGYNRNKQSVGVLDAIEINTIVFESSFKKIVFCLLDAIIIEDVVIQLVKQKVQKTFGIAKTDITIGCIHTHSAPAFFKPFFEDVEIDVDLQQSLIPQMFQSITKAIDDLENCSLTISTNTIEGFYGNRNIKDGIANKKFYLIKVFNSNQQLKCIFGNLCCHPTILNGDNLLLSADLFGQLRSDLQAVHNCPIMLSNSYAGDVSTRFYRQLEGVAELERVSKGICQQLTSPDIALIIDKIATTSVEQTYLFDARYDTDHKKMKQYYTDMLLSTSNQNAKIAIQKTLTTLKHKENAGPMQLSLTSNIYLLNNLLIISLPGDITTNLGQKIEKALSGYTVIILGYCENYSNYFVSASDYGKYFESTITRLAKGNADIFINQVIESAKNLLK